MLRSAPRAAKVVLQEWAKASRSELPPKLVAPALWTIRLPTVTSAGHDTEVSGSKPAWRSAAAVTILNVDPGG